LHSQIRRVQITIPIQTVDFRNGLLIEGEGYLMNYRVSKEPCGPDQNGYYFYAKTPIDPETRRVIGKKQRPSLGTKNKEKAKELLIIEILKLHESLSTNRNKKTLFTEFFDSFRISEKIRVKDGDLSDDSHDEDMRYVDKFFEFANKHLKRKTFFLEEVTPTIAKLFLQSFTGRFENESGKRSRQYARRVLRRLFRAAFNEELIASNPFDRTDTITIKAKEPNPFEPIDLSEMVNKMPETNYDLRTWKNGLRFDYNTGLRRENLRTICLKHIKRSKNGILYVFLPKTKPGDPHEVAITCEALSAFHDQIKNLKMKFGDDLPGDLPLFANRKGKFLHPDTISHWKSKVIKKYAPQLRGTPFHSLRRTTGDQATILTDKATAQEILGHKDGKSIDRYARRKAPNLSQQEKTLSKFPRLTPSNDCELFEKEIDR
jgi:integrase